MEDSTVREKSPTSGSDLAGLAAKTASATEHPAIWGKSQKPKPEPSERLLELVRNLAENGQYPTIAKVMVMEAVKVREKEVGLTDLPPLTMDDVYVVWFAYILGGWKALVYTTRPSGQYRYYEVTYDRVANAIYTDTYLKINHTQFNL